MNRILKLQHGGKEIFYIDFSGIKDETQIQSIIEEVKKQIRIQRFKSVYCLSNIESMHFNNRIKDLFIEFIKGNKEYMKASAVIGVSGVTQIVFNGVMKLTGREVRSFTNATHAKDWLISHN